MRTKPALPVILLAALLTSGCSFTIVEPTETGPDATGHGLSEASPDEESSGEASADETDARDTLTCTGQDVEISGDNKNLVLEGECGTVTIVGTHVRLNLAASATALMIAGDDVTVTGGDIPGVTELTGSDSTLTMASLGVVNITGAENSVTADHIEELMVIGSSNKITWTSGTSTPNDMGSQNRFMGP